MVYAQSFEPRTKSLFCQTVFCIQFEKCRQLPFGHAPVSFLSLAEDNFLTQLFTSTSGYFKLNILVKSTSKNQRSELLQLHLGQFITILSSINMKHEQTIIIYFHTPMQPSFRRFT